METVPRAPSREIWSITKSRHFKPPKDLSYNILLNGNTDTANGEVYEPEFGDLMALTEVRPKCIDDLDRPKSLYLIALVQWVDEDNPDRIAIRASKPIVLGEDEDGEGNKRKPSLFVVYLTNMITNLRIWTALKSQLNMNIIKRVLQPDSTIEESCTKCLSEESNRAGLSIVKNAISSFKLDSSQLDAVLSCVATRQCHHQNTVKLIWGPPGTGKTKTVASLLFVLLRINCRTLTCAPTNIAVLGVTSRLMSLVTRTLEYDTYGFGDIVLFGNGERMKIDDHEDLFDIFMDHRVEALSSCLAPKSGWKHNVESMICLLEDPEEMYHLYLGEQEKKNEDNEEEQQEEETGFENEMVVNSKEKEADIYDQAVNDVNKKGIWRRKTVQTLKENKKMEKKKKEASKRKGKLKCDERVEKDNSTQSNKGKGEKVEKDEDPMTFEEFFMKRFKLIGKQLIMCTTDLYTHMPTSFVSLDAVKKMVKALDLLESIGTMYTRAVANKGLKEVLSGVDDVGNMIKHFRNLSSSKTECVQLLKFLSESVSVPRITERIAIQSFCLQNACLIFCTASSSAKLDTEGMRPLELLVIDEAAQLKECESTIALQLSGHKRLLLNVQFRMHPSISLFPNREFYESRILDGPNVKEQTYERHFLRESMYGSYSFINVSHGKEEFDSRYSRKNMVEVAVVSEIVASLFKESVASKQKVKVGCISPYKAQVFAIQQKLGNTYSTDSNSGFSVNVRSVDGFQGGEEDLIIISTVRCNGRGSVGFLSNRQRTNVALTRARHCLWILGNGATLINSGSVWKKLVVDAQARSCFFDASDDKNLAQAVADLREQSRIEEERETLQSKTHIREQSMREKPISPIVQFCARRSEISLPKGFPNTQACFSDNFVKSNSRIKSVDVRKQVLCIIQRLSSGCWHQRRKANILEKQGGTSSQLLEMYTVNGWLNLIWSVDVVREGSKDFQVLKFWDILPMAAIPKLAEHLDSLFGNYTVDKMNRCKCRRFEGNLVVPVTWPAVSGASKKTSTAYSDYVRPLESRLTKLSIMDEPGSPSNRYQVNAKVKIKEAKDKGMKKNWRVMKQEENRTRLKL
ncbi:hypothetical protein RHMOL_Rhmol08G0026800 [Rhododendron molle]|uniref:Uncharacterized protein n=1 Tax=Rhododendron molle TaxID=49168 RepID=A0ACC0MIU6_RHOML|nr:hypothetical protein RHMOL_Rhmol08G0026800 [Rhododendron molle]